MLPLIRIPVKVPLPCRRRSPRSPVPAERPFWRQVCGARSAFRVRGQGMTEYIIIVALISVAAIAVYQFFGQVVRSQTAAMAREIAGQDGGTESTNARTAAQGASGQIRAKSLSSFTGNVEQAGGGEGSGSGGGE